MPLPAFMRLTDEKKRALADAAIREFSAAPYDKVSVFKIARSAGISRSGFYYYFTGKEDIYRYLLELLENDFYTSLPERIDIFCVPVRMLEHFAAFKGTEMQNFVERVLENLKPSVHTHFSAPFLGSLSPFPVTLLGLEQFRSRDPIDMRIFFFLSFSCTVLALQRYYQKDISLDNARAFLERTLEMLRCGVCR
ncbi:MAG: TetR/AcrR family transcriptional regulator [Eubacteriales bacterium]